MLVEVISLSATTRRIGPAHCFRIPSWNNALTRLRFSDEAGIVPPARQAWLEPTILQKIVFQKIECAPA
jgi:hypothetical protein